MVAKQADEGDLFPRGAAPNAPARIKKRDGQILFGPESKRPRKSRQTTDAPPTDASVINVGAALSYSRVSPGMTVLAIVVTAHASATEFLLPSGIRAVGVDDTLLDDVAASVVSGGELQRPQDLESDSEDDDSSSEEEDPATDQNMDESGDDDDNDDDVAIRPVWELLTIGQVLPVSIVGIEKTENDRRVVTVSLKPHLVNVGLNPDHLRKKRFQAYAAVRSVEDHGYILSFGTNIPHTAFLPFEECDQPSADCPRLRAGSPIQVVTVAEAPAPSRKRKGSVSVRVSAKRSNVLPAAVDILESATFQDLRAGMAIRARVMQAGSGGLSLLALGVFPLAVDAAHCPCLVDGSSSVSVDDQVVARILYVDASVKSIGASLLPCLVKDLVPRPLPSHWKIGILLKRLKVQSVKPGHGLTLRHLSGNGENHDDVDCEGQSSDGDSGEDDDMYGDIPIFAHISRVHDVKGVQLEAKFHKDFVVTAGARIISTSPIDGIVNVDLRPSILSRKALTIDEVVVGSLYDCKVLNHGTFGSLKVAVDGDAHLVGVIRDSHISDVPLSRNALAKHKGFQIGATVKSRVLSVEVDRGRIFLSARKSFTDPKYPVLTSLEEVSVRLRTSKGSNSHEGLVFSGTTFRVTERCNLLVQFCNRIVGLVPHDELCLDRKNRLSMHSKEAIEAVYPIGQTVFVRVIDADPNMQSLRLSMSLQNNSSDVKPGGTFDATLHGVDLESRHFVASIKVVPSHLSTDDTNSVRNSSVSKVDDEEAQKIECHLPFGHLSDVAAMSDLLAAELTKRVKSKKSKKSPVVIQAAMSLHSSDGVTILTAKESLKCAFENGHIPSSYSEVRDIVEKHGDSARQIVRGYVKAILPTGVIVGFLGEVVGLVRKSRVADHFVSDPARVVKTDQSVCVSIESFDNKMNQFELSIRHSDVGYDGLEQDTISTFGTMKKWQKLLGSRNIEKAFPIGSVTVAVVDSVHAYGVEYTLASGEVKATGVALNMDEVNPELDDKGNEMSSKKSQERSSSENNSALDNSGASGNVGDRHNVRVIDVDPITGVVDLSDEKELISGGSKSSVLEPRRIYQARVLLVKSMYIILAVQRSTKRSVIAFALGPILSDNLAIRPGTAISCKVLNKTIGETKRELVAIDWEVVRGKAKSKVTRRPHGDNYDEVYGDSISVLRSSVMQDETAIVGLKIFGKVTKRFPLFAYVGIADGVVGHLHVSKTATLSEAETSSLSLGALKDDIASRFALPAEGTSLRPVYVSGMRRAADQIGSGPMIVELSLHEQNLQSEVGGVKKGQCVLGFVKRLSTRFSGDGDCSETKESSIRTVVAVGSSTLVSCYDVDCLTQGEKTKKISIGTPVLCLITRVTEEGQGHAYGSLSENGKDGSQFFHGIVEEISPGVGLRVTIPWLSRSAERKNISWGTVDICDVAGDFDETVEMMSNFKIGDIVRVRRVPDDVGDSDDGRRIVLSMRKKGVKAVDTLIDSENVKNVKEGSAIRGFIKSVTKAGCFVTIGHNVVARVKLCDLSDEFVKSPEEAFPVGKLISGIVSKTSMVKGQKRISLVLRKRPRGKLVELPEYSDLKEGAIVDGIVKRVERYGAIIEVSKHVLGLLHTSEVDQDRFVEDPHEEWVVGQKIRAVVIKVEGRKIRLGTQRCYFEAAGVDEDKVDEIFEKNERAKMEVFEGQRGGGVDRMIDVDVHDDDDDDDDDQPDEVMNEESDDEGAAAYEVANESEMSEDSDADSPGVEEDDSADNVAPLKVSHRFDFADGSGKANAVHRQQNGANDDISSSDEEGKYGATSKDEPKKRSSRDKREKKRLKEAAEVDIRVREEMLAQADHAPETSEDYERMLVGEPNSCVLWIRYMAFCVQLSKMEKARAVAERALETIALERETDRMNVWIAYINMEAQFGTLNGLNDANSVQQHAAVFRVFDRGCSRVTDVEAFHLQVAQALRDSHRDIAAEILNRACRRFKGSKSVWISVGLMRFSGGDLKEGRKALERALLCLDKGQHVDIINKFAQLEFKYGSIERGRTVFESLVGNFPKRVDLWNVYLDMQVGQCRVADDSNRDGVVDQTRRIFERFVGLDLSSKKMKFAFKKWLHFEKEFGGKDRERSVKQRAREYVERVERNIST